MKKRPFVLIEVLIAIALLALCAFPLISEPLFAQKKMREKYFEIELERKAEEIFYNVLQSPLSMKNITTSFSKVAELPPMIIDIAGLGKRTYEAPHYHLYHCREKETKGPYYNVHLGICFEGCQKDHKNFKYKFKFLGKVVEEKGSNLHFEEKKALVHEELSSNIQAVCESGGKAN